MDPVALAQAGPVAILLVGIGLLATAFIRGAVVPGWLYSQERARREQAEEQALLNAFSLAALARATQDSNGHLSREVVNYLEHQAAATGLIRKAPRG